MTTLALACGIAIAWPKNLTLAVGGLSLAMDTLTNVAWHDPKSGFFAYKSYECDGSHRMARLTKDRRLLTDFGYDMARFGRGKKGDGFGKVLDHEILLSTKHGVKIGTSKSAVIARLGTPVKSATKGSKGEFWCALYKKVVMETKEEGQVLRNTYIFKNGKLIEITVNLDSVPGCGEDSLSDEGWPWTRF